MNDTSLFCTFTTIDNLDHTISAITQKYKLFRNLYVLENLDNPEQAIITYNIFKYEIARTDIIIPTTIHVHRKKLTNTIYTINALNHFIANKNSGKYGIEYRIDWEEIRNCILVNAYNNLKVIPTKLQKVISPNGNVTNTNPVHASHRPV